MTNNPFPNDGEALKITFKGRNWLVLYSRGEFQAITDDKQDVPRKEARKLIQYLIQEGFIPDPNQPPPQLTTI